MLLQENDRNKLRLVIRSGAVSYHDNVGGFTLFCGPLQQRTHKMFSPQRSPPTPEHCFTIGAAERVINLVFAKGKNI